MSTLSPMTAPGGSIALLPIKERLPTWLTPVVTSAVARARRAQRNAVRDEAALVNGKQVRRDEGGGGDFRAVAQFGAEHFVPGREVDRGVERAQNVQAQVHRLVEKPAAQVVPGVEAVGAFLHPAQQQPFHRDDFQGEQHDEGQARPTAPRTNTSSSRPDNSTRSSPRCREKAPPPPAPEKSARPGRAKIQKPAAAPRTQEVRTPGGERSRAARASRARFGRAGIVLPRGSKRKVLQRGVVLHHGVQLQGRPRADKTAPADGDAPDFQHAVLHLVARQFGIHVDAGIVADAQQVVAGEAVAIQMRVLADPRAHQPQIQIIERRARQIGHRHRRLNRRGEPPAEIEPSPERLGPRPCSGR